MGPGAAPVVGCGDEVISPRQVFLFSGHMIDVPGRTPSRFPPALVPAAAQALAGVLDAHAAGPADVAIAQAASGGDLLFLEACLDRGVRVWVMLPFAAPDFIERSVLPAQDGKAWRARFEAVMARLPAPPRIMPADDMAGDSPYERCNRWMLDTAQAWGADRLCFICLWDGGGGDGPGGTASMCTEVERRGGRFDWIDIRKL
ncbi:MAG: hypothetical protein JNK52_07870 [Zoogloeaceae bacterium]|nr:hypothetical protein [Zoogloeaceae bacterium]